MRKDGHCECGGYLMLDRIVESNIQMYVCYDCKQVYYRKIYGFDIVKTLDLIV